MLPNACETKMVVTMNARSLQNFFHLRCCSRAQWEIRQLAEEMFRLVYPVAPHIFAKAGPACVSGPCPEGRMCCGRTAEVRARGWCMSKGKLIVLEGLDGSGKGTQAKLLAKHLTVTDHLVREITFPDYDSDSSALVKMYLAGQFGDKPDDVNAYAASSFYAVDRYAGYKSDWGEFYEEGGILIADRYTTSNAVHQCSKLPPEQWDTFLQWLFDYEYHLLGLPAPDKVIYLQVDPAVSQRLMTARYHGDETRKDVHEKDTEYLARSRRAAEYCAAHLGWDTVHCTAGEKMRSIEDIQEEVRTLAFAVI